MLRRGRRHVFCVCAAIATLRIRNFGKKFPKINILSKVDPKNIVQFFEELDDLRVFINVNSPLEAHNRSFRSKCTIGIISFTKPTFGKKVPGKKLEVVKIMDHESSEISSSAYLRII